MKEKNLYLNRIFLLICLTIGTSYSFAQSCVPLTRNDITNPGIYNVASLTESDGIRNGPDYSGATIYYPTNATPPFTGIAIVPGFVSAQSTIQTWGPFYASHGIVAITIGTNSLFDNPDRRRDALLDALVTIAEENTRTNSPLFGNLDTDRMAVSGWSMGGGGAQLAATANPSLKAVVALCPWLGSPTTTDLDHPVPLLIFSAEQDGTAPPASHADIHYDYTPPTTNKLIYEIANAGHSEANGPTGGQEMAGKIAISWLKKHLIGDDCYCPLLLDTPLNASKYLTNVTCSLLPLTLVDFVGWNRGYNNALEWETVNEVNVKSFDIEKSADGIDFETIETLPAIGGSEYTSYSSIDESPYSTTYYRLKMEDWDAQVDYSETIRIQLEKNEVFNVFPNPVESLVNLSFNQTIAEPIQVEVLDAMGRFVFSQESNSVQGMNTLEIDLGAFPAGVYILNLIRRDGAIAYRQKLIKL